MDYTVLGRRIGNVFLILGYFILLHVDLLTGIYIRIFANSLIIPWTVKNKVWDLTLVLAFLIAIEISKIFTM